MTASQRTRPRAHHNLNDLRRGYAYLATTPTRSTAGEYLGMETPHGVRSILLRHAAGTESIAVQELTSIRPSSA